MYNLFESFRSFVENDRKAFLASHLQNPEENTNFLVFADWLEENGDPEMAKILRSVVKGYEPKKSYHWMKDNMKEMLHLANKADIFDVDYTRMTFQLHGDKKIYRIVPGGLEYGNRTFKPLPENEWSNKIIDAAVFVLIHHYFRLPPQLHGNDQSVFDFGTSPGMQSRTIDALTGRIGHLIIEKTRTLTDIARIGGGLDQIRTFRQDSEMLEKLFDNWHEMMKDKNPKQLPELCEKAQRVNNAIAEFRRVINYNYGFLVPLINWVPTPRDLITQKMIRFQNFINSSCN